MKLNIFVKGITATTGVIAFFLLYGTVGALETDLISIGQAVIRSVFYLSYIIAMQIICAIANKKAPRYGNTKRASQEINSRAL